MKLEECIQGLREDKTYFRRHKQDKVFIKLINGSIQYFWQGYGLDDCKWKKFYIDEDDLKDDWEEYTPWKEINWKEAVDCHNEGIPLQRFRLGEWIDVKNELNLETLGFICNSKWRKKVED